MNFLAYFILPKNLNKKSKQIGDHTKTEATLSTAGDSLILVIWTEGSSLPLICHVLQKRVLIL